MGRREENGAVGADAFCKAEALAGDGRGAVVIPVVEIGASLAGDGESVFKSRGGDEGDARAFAFEQRVGGDGGAVADFNGGFGHERGNFVNCLKDGAAWIVWGGGKLEDMDAAADAVDAVSEGAAGVDGDGEVRGHSPENISAEAASE